MEDVNSKEVGAKYFILSDQEIKNLVSLSAREGAKAYYKEQEKSQEERDSKVRNSARFLIIHYKRLKNMRDTAVYDNETVNDPTLKEIFNELLGRARSAEFDISSIEKKKLKTGIILDHVDMQLKNYKEECVKSSNPEVQRRYRVIEMMYLRENSLKMGEVACLEIVDKSTIYRTLGKAYDDLAALFFGIEAVYSVHMGKDGKKCRAKKTH